MGLGNLPRPPHQPAPTVMSKRQHKNPDDYRTYASNAVVYLTNSHLIVLQRPLANSFLEPFLEICLLTDDTIY